MNTNITKAMILAAGEGTRLRPLTDECPKPLLPLNDIPMIEYTLSWLKSHGIREIAINLYHHGDKIKQCLGDGRKYGLSIYYSKEAKLLGTAGGTKKAENFFDGPFVVVYGDILTDFDLTEMIQSHREKKSNATIALMSVAKPWEVGVISLDTDNRITSFVEKPARDTEIGNLANAGIYILEREVLEMIPDKVFCDFGYEILPKLVNDKLPIYGYRLKESDYILDTGTIEKYNKANVDAKEGKLRVKNLYRAVFLDRDGTIAPDIHYCSRVDDFELFPDAAQAIKLLKDNGFKVVIITNQSGIARGYFTEETLAAIHKKLHNELQKHGTDVDAIYYCPHHPDDKCACRKPQIALFQQASTNLGIDSSISWVIGDLPLDIDAGKTLGSKTIHINSGSEINKSTACRPEHTATSILAATHFITGDKI